MLVISAKGVVNMDEQTLVKEIEELKRQVEFERQRAEIAQLKLENEELKFSLKQSTTTAVVRDRLYTKDIPDWCGDGIKPGDAELYLDRFERVAVRNGWHDEEKKEVLLSKMKGTAERYLRIHGGEFRACKEWKEVKALFRKRFSKERDLLADMRTLLKLKRQTMEDYRTYADRCEEAGILAFPIDDLPSEEQREGARAVMRRVVLGMFQLGTEAPVRRFLKGQNVGELESAVTMAERMSSEYDLGESSHVRQVGRYTAEDEDVPICYCHRSESLDNLDAVECPSVRKIKLAHRNQRIPHIDHKKGNYHERKENVSGNKVSPKTPCPRCGEHGHWMRDCRRNKIERCHKCGQEDHFLEQCPEIKCFSCGEFGHVRRLCRKGEPNKSDSSGENLKKPLNRRGSE